MQDNKITSHPPKKSTVEMEEFILGAEKKGTKDDKYKQKIKKFPWEDSSVRDDVTKAFTAQLPEEYILKIKFLSDYTNKSQQKIVREIICQQVDKLLANFLEN